MPAPYSNDLREKVLIAVDRGMNKSEAGRIFSIHRKTIERWVKQRDAIGSGRAKVGYQRGSNHAITDWRQFRQFAQEHGDKTQAEMAQAWEGRISQRTLSRALKRIGFTRKKKTYGYRERNEAKRQAFLAKIATNSPETLVYLDKSQCL